MRKWKSIYKKSVSFSNWSQDGGENIQWWPRGGIHVFMYFFPLSFSPSFIIRVLLLLSSWPMGFKGQSITARFDKWSSVYEREREKCTCAAFVRTMSRAFASCACQRTKWAQDRKLAWTASSQSIMHIMCLDRFFFLLKKTKKFFGTSVSAFFSLKQRIVGFF